MLAPSATTGTDESWRRTLRSLQEEQTMRRLHHIKEGITSRCMSRQGVAASPSIDDMRLHACSH